MILVWTQLRRCFVQHSLRCPRTNMGIWATQGCAIFCTACLSNDMDGLCEEWNRMARVGIRLQLEASWKRDCLSTSQHCSKNSLAIVDCAFMTLLFLHQHWRVWCTRKPFQN